MTMQEMINAYERASAAHKYMLGFVHDEKLYYVTLSFAELSRFFKLSRMSSKRGGYAKIRIRMNAAERLACVEAGANLLGSSEMLAKTGLKNKGEAFEKIMVETFTDRTWKKDSNPFYRCGDMQVNGEEIQIKFNEAELTNALCLSRLQAMA